MPERGIPPGYCAKTRYARKLSSKLGLIGQISAVALLGAGLAVTSWRNFELFLVS